MLGHHRRHHSRLITILTAGALLMVATPGVSNGGEPNLRLEIQWGTPGSPGDIPVPGKFLAGSVHADLAVWHPETGEWHIKSVDTDLTKIVQWGAPGDKPLVADMDGDNRDDFVIYRPINGTWYVKTATGVDLPTKRWGAQDDVPLSADIDGDHRSDYVIWSPSTGFWRMAMASGAQPAPVQWGTQGDIPMAGDYNGLGDDYLIWRPSTGRWYIRGSGSRAFFEEFSWGMQEDVPLVVGQCDRVNPTIWRPTTGMWYPKWDTYLAAQLGVKPGQPVSANFMGQTGVFARDDIAFWNPINATWYIRQTLDGCIW